MLQPWAKHRGQKGEALLNAAGPNWSKCSESASSSSSDPPRRSKRDTRQRPNDLHDTDQSHSLLQQLRVKDKLSYLDSADPLNPNNLMATPGLVLMRMTAEANGATGHYVALLGMDRPSGVRLVPFAGWWQNDVMKVDGT